METEEAYAMVRRLAREEGLLVGISSGCNVRGRAQHRARSCMPQGEKATIVTVLCDSAEKYLSEHFWDEMITNDPHRIRSRGRAMVAHAQATYPNECCGAMLGSIDGERRRPCAWRCRCENAYAGAQAARITNCVPKICCAPTKKPAAATWT